MSFVTVRGGEHCELRFDARHNQHIANQIATALRLANLPPARERHGRIEITMSEAIQAGLVQLVHFDWDACELRGE